MIQVNSNTKVGSYTIVFFGSNDGKGGRLEFSQSSGSNRIKKEVDTYDWEHKLRDRNFEELKLLSEKYQDKLSLLVKEFHGNVDRLLEEISDDLEKLK